MVDNPQSIELLETTNDDKEYARSINVDKDSLYFFADNDIEGFLKLL